MRPEAAGRGRPAAQAALPPAGVRPLGAFSWPLSLAAHGGFLAVATYGILLPAPPPADRKPLPPLIIHPSASEPVPMEFLPPAAIPAVREKDPMEAPDLRPPEAAVPRLEAPEPHPLVVSSEPLPADAVPARALNLRLRPPAVREPAAVAPAPAEIETVSAPRPAQPIRIDYPVPARRRGLEGAVEVEIAVDETGAVTTLRVAVSSGHPLLDRAALRGLAGVRFTPALRNGRPVPHTFRQSVRFVLREAP